MLEIRAISRRDDDYPLLLNEIHSPPQILYVRGEIVRDAYCIAIVGTRKPTRYGIEAVEKIVRGFAAASPRITIISGLAAGIDSRAHEVSLAAGLRTIGILGSGMDHTSFFPPQNRGLAEKIISAGGAVLSEYPEGTPALKHHFPERNRIVAGMSKGIVVIEAGERSGALITARLALEENRDVFAVPGSIFSPNSLGPNTLIQHGAKLATNADDILEELGIEKITAESRQIMLFGDEKIIFETLSREPRTTDELRGMTDISTGVILSAISMLELKGYIKNFGNDTWGCV